MDVDFKRIFSLDVFIKINKTISIFIKILQNRKYSKSENIPNQKILQTFFYIYYFGMKYLILKYNLHLIFSLAICKNLPCLIYIVFVQTHILNIYYVSRKLVIGIVTIRMRNTVKEKLIYIQYTKEILH